MKRLLTIVFIAALAGCSKPPAFEPLSGGNPRAGLQLLDRYGCAACHQIKGVTHERGQVGPSLTDIRERSFVGGILPNSAANLEQWIMHPRAINPKSAMPELGVTQAEARDMAAYLYLQ